MKVESGKLFLNRTWKYIYPALRVYGQDTINYLNSLIKLGVGIQDQNYEPEHKEDTPMIFILIQTQLKESAQTAREKNYLKYIDEFFTFIRKQVFYIDDYLYDIKDNCCYHMVVLRFPESFKHTFGKFIVGKYSEMYHKTIIDKFFPIKNLNKVYNKKVFKVASSLGENLEIHSILKKDEDFKEEFLRIINDDFGLDMSLEELADREFDYPPDFEEEVFNYSEISDSEETKPSKQVKIK